MVAIAAPPDAKVYLRRCFRSPRQLPAPLAVTAFRHLRRQRRRCARACARCAHERTRANDFGAQPLPCWIGRVAELEDAPLPPAWQEWESRIIAWPGSA